MNLSSSSPSPPQRRRVDEKRSKQGCLTCRGRRKKCPEDFQTWADGFTGCSACHVRRQTCNRPSPTSNHAVALPNPSKFHRESGTTGGNSSSSSNHRHNGLHANRGSSSSLLSMTSSSSSSSMSASMPPLASHNSAIFPSPETSGHPAPFQNGSYTFPPFPQQSKVSQVPLFMEPQQVSNSYQQPSMLSQEPQQQQQQQQQQVQHQQAQQPIVYQQAAPLQWQQPTIQADVSFEQILSRNAWLDQFFDDFMDLTAPLLMDGDCSNSQWLDSQMASPETDPSIVGSRTVLSPSPSFVVAPSSHQPGQTVPSAFKSQEQEGQLPAQPQRPKRKRTVGDGPAPTEGGEKASVPWSSSNIGRLVESQDLDDMLTKYSGFYEKLWRSIGDVTDPESHGALIDHIMKIVKSSKLCKSAMVASCLAYHDLCQRQIQKAQGIDSRSSQTTGSFVFPSSKPEGSRKEPSPPPSPEENRTEHQQQQERPQQRVMFGPRTAERQSTFSSADGKSASSIWNSSQFAHAWYEFSCREFRANSTSSNLEARLVALFDLRATAMCLKGAKECRKFEPDVQKLIAELKIDVPYLLATEDSGTILSFLIQGLALTDIVDGCTVRGTRSAVFDADPNHRISPLLEQDRLTAPHFDFDYVSSLSIKLLICLKYINDMGADCEEGKMVRGSAEFEERAKWIETNILAAQVDVSRDETSTSRLRTFGLHEMWREAVFIHLYQVVYRLGCMAKKVQHSLEQIIKLSEMMQFYTPKSTGDWRGAGIPAARQAKPRAEESATNLASLAPYMDDDKLDTIDMSMVWFLAATVAITPEHREICLLNLGSIGQERVLQDNVTYIKKLWQLTDSDGRSVDWHDMVKEHGFSVSYLI